MSPDILSYFPNFKNYPYTDTSKENDDYNCIAYACGIDTLWYWPPPYAGNKRTQFWPSNVPASLTIESFIKLFESFNYQLCSDDSLEEGFLKVAIFEKEGMPKHAARQLPDGSWTSKLGMDIDISHSIKGMNGGFYGDATTFLKRSV